MCLCALGRFVWPAASLPVPFSVNPLADVARAVLETSTSFFNMDQKAHPLAAHEVYLPQIQNDFLLFRFNERLQLRQTLVINSPTQCGDDDLAVNKSPDP